jgi:predicted nucleic acid-binding protein
LIAIDTSSLRRFLAGDAGRDVDLVRDSVARGRAVLPPVVVCETLSDPATPSELIEDILLLPVLEILEGYWSRAGLLRALLIRKGQKAKLADVLIAQSCIDHQVPLVTFDRDFRHFSPSGLILLS